MILVKLCDFVMTAFVCEPQYIRYRDICCSLYKSMSTKVTVWQLCDSRILAPQILWFCSIVIWALLTLVRFCDFAKMALVCERHDMGYWEICCHFPSFFSLLSNSLSIIASDKHYEIITCIFDSFVCDSSILDPCKILWLCKDSICLWMTWHRVQRNILRSLQKHFPLRTVHEVQRNVLQSLQKHFPSIFFIPLSKYISQ